MSKRKSSRNRPRVRAAMSLSGDREYEFRRKELAKIGFASYRAFLKSKLWAEVRARVLARDGECCRCCGRHASQVHHMSYHEQVLRGVHIGFMVSVCGLCHKAMEYDREGRKLPLCGSALMVERFKLRCRMVEKVKGRREKLERRRARRAIPDVFHEMITEPRFSLPAWSRLADAP